MATSRGHGPPLGCFRRSADSAVFLGPCTFARFRAFLRHKIPHVRRRKYMREGRSAQQASARVQKAIERMREDLPQLATIFDAFKDLLAAQEALKADLPVLHKHDLSIDPVQYSQGVPILAKEVFSLSQDNLRISSRSSPACHGEGIPKIKDQLNVSRRPLRTRIKIPESV